MMAQAPTSNTLDEHAVRIATEIAAQDARGLDRGAVHIATVIGTIGSGMLDHDGSLVADATSYEEIPEGELSILDDGPVLLEQEIAAREPYVPEWETYTVQSGDAFAVMAQNRLGLGYSEVLALLDQLPDRNMLERWRVGTRLDYQLDEDGSLLSLRMMRDARSGFVVEREGEAFEVASIERTGEAAQRLFAGTVSGSFTRSAQATGLSSTEVSRLTHVLGKKLDFRRDTRRGDRFQVLVESDVIDGESFDPRILAVQYEGERTELTLVRNSSDNNFYTPEGESLDPAFNRYPFEGRYRLSSNFNPRRKHPVTGRVSPHKGTDFAMPIGTPITAPSDGVVESVRSHYAAGRYVVIRHDNGYRTRYLHLSKPLVSRGERVSMGQRIALSGNTGRSTGPHLHYEVLVNDNQVDAMQVKLPENRSLAGDRLVAFQREAKPLLATLKSGEVGPVVASAREAESRRGGRRGLIARRTIPAVPLRPAIVRGALASAPPPESPVSSPTTRSPRPAPPPEPPGGRFLGVFRYSRRAMVLVWQTSRALTVGLAIATLVAGVLPAVAAWLGQLIVDAVVAAMEHHEATGEADWWPVLRYVLAEAGVIAAIALAQRALSAQQSLLRALLGQKVNVMILEKAGTLSLAQFEDSEFYDKLTRARREASVRPLGLVNKTFSLAQNGISLISFGVLLVQFSPWAPLVLVIGALPVFISEAKFSGDAFRLFRWRSPQTRMQMYLETVLAREDSIKEVKLFGLEPLLLDRYRKIFDTLYAEDRRLTLRREGWGFVLGLLGTLAFYGAYAWVVVETITGTLSLGQMTMYLMVFKQGQAALSASLTSISGMYEDNLYLSNLYEYLSSRWPRKRAA